MIKIYGCSSEITKFLWDQLPSAKHAIKKPVSSCFIIIQVLGSKNLGTGVSWKKHAPNAVSFVQKNNIMQAGSRWLFSTWTISNKCVTAFSWWSPGCLWGQKKYLLWKVRAMAKHTNSKSVKKKKTNNKKSSKNLKIKDKCCSAEWVLESLKKKQTQFMRDLNKNFPWQII